MTRFRSFLIFVCLLTAAPAARGQAPAPLTRLTLDPVGQLGGPSLAIALAGDFAYLGVGRQVWVLDMRQSAAPVVIGQSEPLFGQN